MWRINPGKRDVDLLIFSFSLLNDFSFFSVLYQALQIISLNKKKCQSHPTPLLHCCSGEEVVLTVVQEINVI
jgi:hypothetical protein